MSVYELLDSSISADGGHGTPLNFDVNPIAPIGGKVITYDPPNERASWDYHG